MDTYTYRHLNAEFASQKLDRVPLGAYIDKTLPGTGFTTLALQDDRDCIIAMPTLKLIENKMFSKDGIDYKGDEIRLDVVGGIDKEAIRSYIDLCKYRKQPIKILITYASLGGSNQIGNEFAPKLDFVLEENPNIALYIDETQDMLKHALRNPAGAAHIYELVDKYSTRTSFISATPPSRKYLSNVLFKLEPIKYTWDFVKYTTRYEMQTSKQFHTVAQMINDIEFAGELKLKDLEPNPRKLIIFVNSITNIKKMIQLTDMDSKTRVKNCGYIAADNINHVTTLKDCAREVVDYANLPKYTFVTSVGISGIDLYDKEAMTVVVSSTKKDWQMLDMDLDLPQAISRQRIKSNPFYGKFIFIYNQCEWDLSKEEMLEKFDKEIQQRKEKIKYQINGPVSRGELTKEAALDDFSESFQGYVYENKGLFILNEALVGAKKHHIMETLNQYTKGFAYKGLDDSTETISKIKLKAVKRRGYKDYVEYVKQVYGTVDMQNGSISYENSNIRKAKAFLRLYCHQPHWIDFIIHGMETNKVYTCVKASKRNYESSKDPLVKLYYDISFMFKTNTFYSSATIKANLKQLYSKHNLKRKAKGSDISQFFVINKETRRVNYKVVRGVVLQKALFEIK